MSRSDSTIIDIIEIAAAQTDKDITTLSDQGAGVVDSCEYITIINPGTTAGALTTVAVDAAGVTKKIPLMSDSVWTEKCSKASEFLISSGDAAMTVILYAR